LETIIEMRAYVRAKQIYETARSAADLPASPLIELVRTFDFELAAIEIAERKQSA
jgi:hypothetical protein